MRLPQFAVRRPNTVMMIFLGISLFGAISLSKLGIDMLPEIEPPAISVLVPYPGASASDVESDVTVYLENMLSAVNNLDSLISLSKDNLSVVTCKFDWGTDLDVASNDVRDKIDLAKSDIGKHAPDAREPMLFKFSSATAPIMIVAVNATESWKNLFRIVDKQIIDPLKRVEGVGAIVPFGGLRRQINVEFDKQRLVAFGLSVDTIVRTLAAENLDMPAGSVKMGRTNYAIRLQGRFDSAQQVAQVVVSRQEGRPIYLRDVARVEDAFKEQKMKGWANGKDAIVFLIQKQSGANTVAVAEGIRAKLAELQDRLPADVSITIPMDNSEFIVNSVKNLARTLVLTGLLVGVFTFLFLRRWVPTIIVLLNIPFSIIGALTFMFVMGYTINIVSLMSLAIAIGMVVSNPIFVMEVIWRHIEQDGQKPRQGAVLGASEVGTAITASTLTTVVVFGPLIFVTGLASIIFGQLGMIVAVTLIGSLFTALTLTPMLASRWIKPAARHKNGRFYRFGERLLTTAESFYERALGGALQHRKKILLSLLGVFMATVALVPLVGTDLFPDVDTGDLDVCVALDESARLEETESVAMKLAGFYPKFVPEKRDYYTFVGETEEGVGSVLGTEEGPNVVHSGAKLVAKDRRTRSAKEVATVLRQQITEIPGIERMTVMATTPMKQMLLGGGKQIEVEIIGHDLEITDQLAEKVRKIFEKTPGAIDTRVSRKNPRSEVWITLDRPKAASLGVTAAAVATALRTHYYGFEATKFRDAGDDFNIFVRLNEENRATLDGIGDITVPSTDEDIGLVTLSNIARIDNALGPVQIDRKNRERIVKVGADVEGRSLGEVKADVERELNDLEIPPGVTVDFGGEVEEQRKTFAALGALFFVGIILVYMVMVSQFESLRTPFVIAFSVPFAFVGVVWAFLLTGITLNIMSFMGMILLVGVVVNNGIVLIDYANILRAKGLSMLDSVKQAGSRRLRPVLMTTLITIFGVLPLAISRGEGAEMWQPFAVTVIAGLIVSTLVTLILIPILYSYIASKASPSSTE